MWLGEARVADSFQLLLVIATLVFAVGFLARRGWRWVRGTRNGCVRGCFACPLSAKNVVVLDTSLRRPEQS
jgi:hypothetical protein